MGGVRVKGLLGVEPFELTVAACRAAPERARVADAGALVPGRPVARTGFGAALAFAHVLDLADPPLEARWVTVESEGGDFAASLALEELAGDAWIVYERDGAPLDVADGGPFRLLIPGYRDACANVKHLAALTFSDAPGRDTRASRTSGGAADCPPTDRPPA